MTIAVVVQRGLGTRPAEDIVNPLLGSPLAAVEKGRVFLDQHAEGLSRVTLDALYRSGVELGQLVEGFDGRRARTYRGKVVGVDHRFDGGELITVLQLETA